VLNIPIREAWKYENVLNGDFQIETDMLDVTIKAKTSNGKTKLLATNENKSFCGFIAYWSSIINSNKFDPKIFIPDFENIFTSTSPLIEKTEQEFSEYNFSIVGENGKWKICQKEVESLPFNVSVERIGNTLTFTLSGKYMNIFYKEKDIKINLCSLLSEITQKRNYKAGNPAFIYTTEPVSPSSWATPHIRYFSPIKIGSNTMQNIFEKIMTIKLPYKSEAKLLISNKDLNGDKLANLPVIPIKQMEFNAGELPSEVAFDDIFKKYNNGYPSISLTIYSDGENDLPIFFANNIYKSKEIGDEY
jgi:hypothetical protein